VEVVPSQFGDGKQRIVERGKIERKRLDIQSMTRSSCDRCRPWESRGRAKSTERNFVNRVPAVAPQDGQHAFELSGIREELFVAWTGGRGHR
jgi:hypothetical protein